MPLFNKTKTATPNDAALNRRIIDLAQRHGDVFDAMLTAVAPGVSTTGLAEVARRAAQTAGLAFSFREQGFPDDVSICRKSEVNNAIPKDDAPVRNNELLRLAFGAVDTDATAGKAYCVQNWSVAVGEVPAKDAALQNGTRACLDAALAQCVPGGLVSAIVHAMHEAAQAQGIFLTKHFAGHAVGNQPQMAPQLLAPRGMIGEEWVLSEGCMLSLFVLGHPHPPKEDLHSDGWTVYDKNRFHSAYFSHMVLIEANGPRVISREHRMSV